MGRNKSGPKKKPGERYPSGKRKPTGDPIAPAAWQRVRADATKLIGDPRLGSEVGRLSLHRELTDVQVAAAFRVGAIYGLYEKHRGLKRSARSPSYEQGFTGIAEELLSRQALSDRIRAEQESERAFLGLQDRLCIYSDVQIEMLERLCCEDRHLRQHELDLVRPMLDRLASIFGISGSTRQPRQFRRHRPKPTIISGPRPLPDIDRTAWGTIMQALRPDMDATDVADSFDVYVAMKAREAFNRAKTRRK